MNKFRINGKTTAKITLLSLSSDIYQHQPSSLNKWINWSHESTILSQFKGLDRQWPNVMALKEGLDHSWTLDGEWQGQLIFLDCCILNGFSNRGFTSISSLAKQRHSPAGFPKESDGWISGSHCPYKLAPYVSSHCSAVELYKVRETKDKRSIKMIKKELQKGTVQIS